MRALKPAQDVSQKCSRKVDHHKPQGGALNERVEVQWGAESGHQEHSGVAETRQSQMD